MAIDTDLFVVVGLTLAFLALPSIAASFVERTPPKTAIGMLCLGLVLALIGYIGAPQGYGLDRVPHSYVEILGRIFN